MEKINSKQLKKNPDTKEIEKDDQKKKQKIPFMQVDKNGDIVSNFLSNFMRQFKNQEGKSLFGLLGSLLGLEPKPQPEQKQPAKPYDIMGPVQDDKKLAKERRERWQELRKGLTTELSKNQSRAASVNATKESEHLPLANKAKKTGLRM